MRSSDLKLWRDFYCRNNANNHFKGQNPKISDMVYYGVIDEIDNLTTICLRLLYSRVIR